MVAYSFQPEFAIPIIGKTKSQTIRKARTGKTRDARTGDELQLFTGLRTKQTKLLGTARCHSAGAVALEFDRDRVVLYAGSSVLHRVAVYVETPEAVDTFARMDGFADWKAMKAFWNRHHPGFVDRFEGVIILWEDFKCAT